MKELEAFGITKDDLLSKLVEKLTNELLSPDEETCRSDFEQSLSKELRKVADAKIQAAIDAHIAPGIGKMIDDICLQKTNEWGEAKGAKLTFTEYLVERIDAYIREPVNYAGKTKGEEGGWSFNAKGTRIQHMIDEHLKYTVQAAVQTAMQNATTSISKSLKEAAEIAINNVQVSVKTDVSSK